MSKGVVAVLLVVVLGLGFVVGRMSVPNATEAPTADADAPSGERPSVAPVTAPAPAAAPTLAASGDPVTEAFRAAYERLPAPAQVRGDGVISGTVRSDTGEPIAGAVVTGVARGLPNEMPDRDTRATPDPAEDLRQLAERMASQAAARRQATSGPDGTWRLEGLADLEYRIQASAPGWAFRTSAEAYHGVRPGATVELVGTPRSSLIAEVRLDGGGAPESARIELRNATNTTGLLWSPSRPTLDVEPGSYVATARTEGETSQSSDPVDVEIMRGAPASVVFQLRARPALRLRVRWPDGERNPRASASVKRLDGDDAPDSDTLRELAFLGNKPSRDGVEWLFPNLEPGRHVVAVARSRGGAVAAHAIVEVTTRLTEFELVVPPSDRAAYVVVRVTGPDGAPVRDVGLNAGGRSAQSNWSGGCDTIERPDGTTWLFLGRHLAEDAPDVRWWISASHPKFGQRTVEVARGTAMDVEIRLQPPARIDVVVEVPDGGALPGGLAVAFADASEGDDRWFGGAGTEAVGRDGHATLRALQPGAGRIVVVDADAVRRASPAVVHRVAVTIESGAQTVRVALPRLHTVTLRGEPSRRVRVTRAGDALWRRNEPLDAKGNLVLKLLPDGDYEAAVGPKRSSFTLPGATEVDLR